MNGFYDSCIELLERTVAEGFMNARHRDMWSVVAEPENVIDALRDAPVWGRDARTFARVG